MGMITITFNDLEYCARIIPGAEESDPTSAHIISPSGECAAIVTGHHTLVTIASQIQIIVEAHNRAHNK